MKTISMKESDKILEPFKVGRVPDKEFEILRAWSARNCHDTIIYMPKKKKILLAVRQGEPAKGYTWPFGGGQTDFPIKRSLIKLIKGESGLDLNPSTLEFFGEPTDHYWSTGPFGNPVHDVGNYFLSEGHGKINPDRLHTIKLIGGEEYMDERENFAHWTRVGMDKAVERFFGIEVLEKTPFPSFYVDGTPYSVAD